MLNTPPHTHMDMHTTVLGQEFATLAINIVDAQVEGASASLFQLIRAIIIVAVS